MTPPLHEFLYFFIAMLAPVPPLRAMLCLGAPADLFVFDVCILPSVLTLSCNALRAVYKVYYYTDSNLHGLSVLFPTECTCDSINRDG